MDGSGTQAAAEHGRQNLWLERQQVPDKMEQNTPVSFWALRGILDLALFRFGRSHLLRRACSERWGCAAGRWAGNIFVSQNEVHLFLLLIIRFGRGFGWWWRLRFYIRRTKWFQPLFASPVWNIKQDENSYRQNKQGLEYFAWKSLFCDWFLSFLWTKQI